MSAAERRLLRGLGVANLLSDDTARRTAILRVWQDQLHDRVTTGVNLS
jgi:hypothetical protein